MTNNALFMSIGLCTVLLSGVAVASHLWAIAGIGLIIGTAWFIMELCECAKSASAGMATMTFLSAVSIIFGAATLPLITTAVLALAAWDLSRLRKRLTDVISERVRHDIEWRHLQRLFSVNIIGMASAVLATGFRFRIDFFMELSICGLVFFMLYLLIRSISEWEDS